MITSKSKRYDNLEEKIWIISIKIEILNETKARMKTNKLELWIVSTKTELSAEDSHVASSASFQRYLSFANSDCVNDLGIIRIEFQAAGKEMKFKVTKVVFQLVFERFSWNSSPLIQVRSIGIQKTKFLLSFCSFWNYFRSCYARDSLIPITKWTLFVMIFSEFSIRQRKTIAPYVVWVFIILSTSKYQILGKFTTFPSRNFKK